MSAAAAQVQTSAGAFEPGTPGVHPPAGAGATGFLSDVLVELGFTDAATVEDALQLSRQAGRTVESVLLESQAIDEEQLARALSARHGFDYVDTTRFSPDPEAAELINRKTALRYGALPVAFAPDGALVVLLSDPVDGLAVDEIEVMTKSDVRVAVASRSGIEGLIQRFRPDHRPPSAAPEGAVPKPAPVQAEEEHPLEEEPSPTPEPAPAKREAPAGKPKEGGGDRLGQGGPGALVLLTRVLREAAEQAEDMAADQAESVAGVEAELRQALKEANERCQELEAELADVKAAKPKASPRKRTRPAKKA
jgi:hypothetical protein